MVGWTGGGWRAKWIGGGAGGQSGQGVASIHSALHPHPITPKVDRGWGWRAEWIGGGDGGQMGRG